MINDNITSWLLRMLKGAFIGSGFIMPGISGGALATVFGLYERMIRFLADIRKDFLENFLFFLPVGLGGIGGVFIFSLILNYFFEVAEMQIIWFFVGCIAGTLPSLWRQAGSTGGHKKHHIATLIICFAVAIIFLRYIDHAVGGNMPHNIYTWLLAGVVIAFGVVIPGLSTSTLLLFLQLYAPMMAGIASLDFSVIIPIGIGGVLTIFLFSRLMAFILDKAYGSLFHGIIGFVAASTLLILPGGFDLLSLVAVILGILLAVWMGSLEGDNKI